MSDVRFPFRHIVPLGSENRWSDLLATLIETDPSAVADLLLLPQVDACSVRVRREAPGLGRDRIDLIISVDGEIRCVIEAKVLSGLGYGQLQRYGDAYPDVHNRVFVFPERLPVHIGEQAGWREMTWEQLLRGLAVSEDAWVAHTAGEWLAHLERSMPQLGSETRWNDLNDGEDFVIAMRARMSWVYRQLSPAAPIGHDLVGSSAGVSWVTRMYLPAAADGYWIYVEAEENLPVRDFPALAGRGVEPLGPSVKVTLQQAGVRTSAGFNWDYLLAMWPTMAAARSDWVQATARPKAAHDRANWKEMVNQGGPRYLGIGFGDAQAKAHGSCMFGARFQLPPDVTLGQVAESLTATTDLMVDMAAVAPPLVERQDDATSGSSEGS
ncbi:PD-(D/E)XK nuclease family protein [Modestobacter sp. SYSU DS0657]